MALNVLSEDLVNLSKRTKSFRETLFFENYGKHALDEHNAAGCLGDMTVFGWAALLLTCKCQMSMPVLDLVPYITRAQDLDIMASKIKRFENLAATLFKGKDVLIKFKSDQAAKLRIMHLIFPIFGEKLQTFRRQMAKETIQARLKILDQLYDQYKASISPM
ncbi:hypothetical protein CVT25_004995 [Psilocybe cyanescens]|uniref:Uncharacterized protein n=1 Tax=Psilocybe cyanescens TaxID=93625 RepID=A0A409X282_PSICY|nr:hypothetical protein CVT25_004995 [Psilocybe cyanescens]